MEVFRGSWSNYTKIADSVVAVGAFDGVHLGHQAVIKRTVESARAQGLRSVVIALETTEHGSNGGNGTSHCCLTTTEEKIALMRECGVDELLLFNGDHTIAQLTAHDFVQIILKGRIGLKRMVIGFNHQFGKDLTGDRESLISMSRAMGFSVEVVNPVRHDDRIVSADLIRDRIQAGEVNAASVALGRFYSVSGVVVHGFGRGRQLNCPTANLGHLPSNKTIPRDGIYAGIATVRGEQWPAAISNGYNPTVAEGRHSVEAHLIGFDDDIYDEQITVEFVERIRDEKKFSAIDELIRQIADDVRVAGELLESRGVAKRVS
jgi:riboflavin kinase/FMN adenylyltransferase